MAIETIILRPTGDDASSITRYPNNMQAWETIAETDADDEASYIVLSSVIVPQTFFFSLPLEYENMKPIKITLYTRLLYEGESYGIFSAYINNSSVEITEGIIVENAQITSSEGQYQNYSFELDSSYIDLFLQKMQIDIVGVAKSKNSKNNATLHCTQLYVELVYGEEEPSEPDAPTQNIYLKSNGIWSAFSNTILIKENNVWRAVDLAELSESNYIIIET